MNEEMINNAIKTSGLTDIKVMLYYYDTKIAYIPIGAGGDLTIKDKEFDFINELLECSDALKSTKWHVETKDYKAFIDYIEIKDLTTRGGYQRFAPVTIIKNPIKNIELITSVYKDSPRLSDYITKELTNYEETKKKMIILINKLEEELNQKHY